MCLLIVNPERREIPLNVLNNAADANPDGFGCAYIRGNKIVIHKSSGMGWNSFDKFCRTVSIQKPQILHFRMATHGSVCKRLSHPFAGKGWVMAHNGILPVENLPAGQSDTSYLAQLLADSNPRDYLEMLAKVCGRSNKLGFLFNDGTTEIVGEELGDWQEGIWYSNGSGFNRQFGFFQDREHLAELDSDYVSEWKHQEDWWST